MAIQLTPDQETIQRIKNLAIVGKALFETESEVSFNTNFFLAKEALNKFKEGIDKLNLNEESKAGMESLVKYLHKKIDKRIEKTTNEKLWLT